MGSFPTHHRLFIMVVREYQVVGRRRPDELYPNPPIFRMRLFCPNEVVAKSKFWYIMKQTHKMKKASGEILSVIRIYERTPKKVKNFGIVCRYDSRTGTHNLTRSSATPPALALWLNFTWTWLAVTVLARDRSR